MRRARRMLVTLATISTIAAPGLPRADAESNLADARAHFQTATQHYQRGRYRAAATEFEAAYRLRPHGAIHFNIAQCRERLGELPGALRSYHDYLREVPRADDRAKVRASIRRLEDRLAAAGVQALLVSSTPPGAEVRIDGRARGKTPFVIALPPGAYAVGLERSGFASAAREVDLSLDAHAVVEVTLRAAPAQPPPAAVASGATAGGAASAGASGAPADAHAEHGSGGEVANARGAPPASPAPSMPDLSAPVPTSLATAPSAPAPRPKEKRRIYTWIAAGVAAVAVGAGAYYGSSAQKKSDDLLGGVHTSEEATALARDADDAARKANVLYGVGAAAAAAGVTLFFVEGRF